MADVTITLGMDTDKAFEAGHNPGPIWMDKLICYWAFITTGEDLVMWKTEDGGATWALAANIYTAASFVLSFGLWFEKWTKDDTGTLIHITWESSTTPGNTSDGLWYRAFDTADGFFEANALRIFQFVAQVDAKAHSSRTIGVVKARGGYLYIGCASSRTVAGGGTQVFFYRSVDAGLNWVAQNDFIEDVGNPPNDYWMLLPGNYADDQDIDCVYDDNTANEVSLKTYDDSAGTWSEAAIVSAGIVHGGNEAFGMLSAAVRHSDGHLILVISNRQNHVEGDILVYDINGPGSITAKTNVVTDLAHIGISLTIDQNTDDLYVFYGDSTAGTGDMVVYYKKSTDGGGTWGDAVQFNSTNRSWFDISTDPSVGTDLGRVLAIMYDAINDDAYTNTDNALDLEATAAVAPASGGVASQLAASGFI